eukprot:CAMPEP_0198149382 /NCGR_PEP_ID=MMETSP1443-20131203/46266_1 /TAXON_ID=186043 /ORGANISM="Entomoneis sp., Strain CCMP2396" /LENGTH=112 /DNA_ID=CAMNT_0043814393 /DNA_START=63 /DNA_END=397 /DNA_ORIENTATION=-
MARVDSDLRDFFEKLLDEAEVPAMYDGQPVTRKDLKKEADNRDETMNNTTPVALTSPGMKDIKRMELWTKWRPLLPFARRKDFFFLDDPGPEMARRVLAERVVRLARRKEVP